MLEIIPENNIEEVEKTLSTSRWGIAYTELTQILEDCGIKIEPEHRRGRITQIFGHLRQYPTLEQFGETIAQVPQKVKKFLDYLPGELRISATKLYGPNEQSCLSRLLAEMMIDNNALEADKLVSPVSGYKIMKMVSEGPISIYMLRRKLLGASNTNGWGIDDFTEKRVSPLRRMRIIDIQNTGLIYVGQKEVVFSEYGRASWELAQDIIPDLLNWKYRTDLAYPGHATQKA